MFILHFFLTILRGKTVLTKTRNETKRAETSQNEPKPAETGEVWNFLIAFVFQISNPNDQI